MSSSESKTDLGAGLSAAKRALLQARLRGATGSLPAGAGDRIPRRPDPTEAPLTHAQERLWLFAQAEPESAAYTMGYALVVEGRFDTAAFAHAVEGVVQRHEALRTTFFARDGIPCARIHDTLPVPVTCVDLSARRDARAEALARAEATLARPFDLDRGPLLRVEILKIASEGHLLAIAMHHIVSDGWSMGVLVRELSALYAEARGAGAHRLPPLPVQYGDFARWQRERVASGALDEARRYHRDRFAGDRPALRFPTDFPRPARPGFAGARRPLRLDPTLAGRVRALAKRCQATPFMVLGAAYAILLHRYTGVDDVTIASPAAGRDRSEIEPLIGYFADVIALRIDLRGAPTGLEVVRQVREATLGAFAHPVPFGVVADDVADGGASPGPLLETLFALQNLPTEALETDTVTMTPLELESGTAKMDLSLYLAEVDGGIAGTLEYRTDLFAPETIDALGAHYARIVEGLTSAPAGAITRLPMLGAEEREDLLVRRNRSRRASVPRIFAHEPFATQAKLAPERLAVEEGSRTLTYRELDARADALAGWLVAQGIEEGDRVGLLLPHGVDLVVAMYAVLKAGGAFVPVDVAYPDGRVATILEDAAPRVLLGTAAELARVPAFGGVTLPLDAPGSRLEDIADLPSREADPGALAYVVYTSGSTGRPKGIAVLHGGVVNHNLACRRAFSLAPSDRVLHFASPGFDATIEEVFPALSCGAAVVTRPHDLLDSFERFESFVDAARITVLPLPTAFWERWTEHLARRGGRLPASVRMVTLSGQRVTAEAVGAWSTLPGTAEVALVNTYGPSEATITTSSFTIGGEAGEPYSGGEVPIGAPWPNYDVYVLDRHGEPVPPGVVGELYIGGVGVSRGYLNRPELTAAAYLPDPFVPDGGGRVYRTGDLVKLRRDGRLLFVGRTDDQVKIRGNRVETAEVEALLAASPLVRECAVVAHADASGERYLVAYVVPRTPGTPPRQALVEHMVERAPAFMVPAVFTFLETMPLTPSGKYDRRALLPPEPGAARRAPYAAPRTSLERALVGAFEAVLATAPIGIDDDFFALGGNSLRATMLLSRVRQATSRAMPLAHFFRSASVRRMAARLASVPLAELTPLGPLPPRESYPAAPAQRRIVVLQEVTRVGTSYNMPFAVELQGALDHGALSMALRALVARHESLRTSFRVEGDAVVQVVAASVPLPLAIEPCAPEDLDARLRGAVAPFDLRVAPLFRARLFALAPERHVLFLDLHHAVADGTSLEVLVSDFFALYQGLPLPALRVHYKELAAWQAAHLESPAGRRQRDYWRARLEEPFPELSMPLDGARPSRPSFDGDTLTFRVPADTRRRLEALAATREATLNIVLLTAYAALVAQYARSTRVVIGSVVGGRTHADAERVVGMFANYLPIALDVDVSRPFAALLDAARSSVLDAYEHQDLPFEEIVALARPSARAASTGQNPLFSTMLIFHNEVDLEGATRALPAGLTFAVRPVAHGTAKLDFKLDVHPEGDGTLLCHLEYNTALFARPTMARFADELGRLFDAVGTLPGTPVASHDVLHPASRAAVERHAGGHVRLGVAATYTAESIRPHVAHLCGRFGLTADVAVAPFHQVVQSLLDPASVLAQTSDVALLLVRPEDFVRDAPDDDDARLALLARAYADLEGALRARRGRAPLLVAFHPLDEVTFGDRIRPRVSELVAGWRAAVEADPGAHVLDLAGLAASFALDGVFDPVKDRAGRVPFTDEYCAALGTTVARRLVALRGRRFKVIAVDCDDTLWAGVAGEDGPLGVVVDQAGAALQRFLAAKKREGMLLALVTKNNEADVLEVFARNPGMLLTRDDFVAARCNWEPKSSNLGAIARELNLGRDSFVFLDDSATECAEVMTNAPDVLTLRLPDDRDAVPRFLEHVWATDAAVVTAEDAERTEMYRAETERRALEGKSTSLTAFLEGLELEVSFDAATDADLDRVAQLTQRTNQFNLNGRRRTRDEIAALAADASGRTRIWVVHLRDRFGDYGLVGACITQLRGTVLSFETLLLSCRALGRTVETAILTALLPWARAREVTELEAELRPTGKNAPVGRFLAEAGFRADASDAGETTRFRLRLDDVPATSAVVSLRVGERLPPRVAASAPARVERYELDHVGVAVRDIEEAARRLAPLGYRRGPVVLDPGQQSYVTLLTRDGSDVVELVAPAGPTSPTTRLLARSGEGPYHLCYRVAALDPFVASLRADGVPFDVVAEAKPAPLFGGRRVQFLFVTGVGLVELLEIGEAAFAPAGATGSVGRVRVAVTDAAPALRFFARLGYAAAGSSAGLDGSTALLLRKARASELEIVTPSATSDAGARVSARGPHLVAIALDALPSEDALPLPPYVERAPRGTTARPAARSWSVPVWNEAALTHRAYLAPLECATGEALLRLPLGRRPGSASDRPPFVAPRTPVERAVADAFAGVLQVDRVGLHDHFFDLGGHSLKAVSIAARLVESLGVEIELGAVFDEPTVLGLSARISGAAAASRAPIPRAPERTSYPASTGQQRLCLLQEMDPASTAYNLPLVLRLEGALDLVRLERALDALVARHEALRTSFHHEAGAYVQRVHRDVACLLAVEDVEEEDVDARLLALLRPFDLAAPPLFRAVLLRERPERSTLFLDVHHAAVDGASFEILVHELSALYRGDELPEVSLQFRDYAAWESERIASGALEASERFFRERFAGGVPSLDLPLDYSRPATQTFAGDAVDVRLSPDEARALHDLAAREEASVYMVLLAAFGLVLARYAGQTDIVIGSPVANRSRPELAGTVGLFVNTVAMRLRPEPDKTFRQLLAEVRAEVSGALAHAAYPFDRLVEAVAPRRDASHNPVFDVMLVLQAASPDLALDDVRVQPRGAPGTGAQVDLELVVVEDGAALALSLRYATALFRRATVAGMAEHVRNALASVGRAPEIRLADVELMSPAERHRVLYEHNATHVPLPPGETVLSLVEATARALPGRIAVRGPEGDVTTYAALLRRADAIARALLEGAPARESFVVVAMERGAEMIAAILGTWKAGLAYIPVEFETPAARIETILRNARPIAVLTRGSSLPESIPPGVVPRVIDVARDLSTAELPRFDARPPSPRDLAYAIYTSGSTGLPKGAMVEHLGMLNHMWAKVHDLALDQDAVVVQNASHAFDISVWQMFAALLRGGTTVVTSRDEGLDAARLLGRVVADGATVLEVVPAVLSALLDAHERVAPGSPSRGLRFMLVTGEALLPSLAARYFARFPAIPLVNAYGPTEASDDVTHHVMRAPPAGRVAPLGRPIDNVRIYVTDPAMRPCPLHVPGEICVAGIAVGRGYIGDAARTSAAFTVDPFAAAPGERLYRTGDVGRWLADGTLEYLGRRDAQVKIRGHRIELGEIEATLVAHPSVSAAAVVVRERAEGHPELVGYWTASGERPADADVATVLREHLLARLPRYMVPALLVELEQLPLSSNGKLDRRALPEVSDQAPPGEAEAHPADAIELALTRAWAAVLGLERAYALDDFFAHGGHSLRVVALVARIREELGVLVPLAEIFRHPTPRALAPTVRRLQRRERVSSDGPLCLRNDGPPVFLFPPIGAFGLAYVPLAAHLGPATVYAFDFRPDPGRIRTYADDVVALGGEGPYVLAGYSAGGNLAFEVAKELEARGRVVSRIVLFDARVRAEGVVREAADVLREQERDLDEGIARADEATRRAASVPAIRAVALEKRLAYATFLDGCVTAGTVSAPLTFVAEDDGEPGDAPADAWALHSRAEVTRVAGAGAHARMMDPPHAAANALPLRRALEEAGR